MLQIDRVLRGDYTTAFEEYQEGDLSILQNQLHKLVIRLNDRRCSWDRTNGI